MEKQQLKNYTKFLKRKGIITSFQNGDKLVNMYCDLVDEEQKQILGLSILINLPQKETELKIKNLKGNIKQLCDFACLYGRIPTNKEDEVLFKYGSSFFNDLVPAVK